MVRILLLLGEKKIVEGLGIRLGWKGCAHSLGDFNDAVPTLGDADNTADGGDTGIFEGAGDDAVGGHHELFNQGRCAVFHQAHNIDRFIRLHQGARLDGFKIERAVLETATNHALGGCVLQLELCGQVGTCVRTGAGGYLGGSGAFALKPCADSVIGELGAVVDERGVDLAV